MAELTCVLAFEAYGARIAVEAPEEVASLVRPALPPTAELIEPEGPDVIYRITVVERTGGSEDAVYALSCEGAHVVDPDFSGRFREVCATLESDMHFNVALAARDWLFVHAGVVEWEGSAIVIPGRTMVGKSSLVLALVEAGATYFSDEYAVLDEEGRVHPYLKPLSERREGRDPLLHPPEVLGKREPKVSPVPLGRVVVTRFRAGATWNPGPITPAEAMMVLFDNTLVARTRPGFALSRLSKAVEGSEGMKGDRGEAKEAAKALLA